MLSPLQSPARRRAWLASVLASVLAFGLAHAQAWAVQSLPALPGAAPRTVTVVSLDIARDADTWMQQREQIALALEQLRPDVIALQDVRQTTDMPNQACWLASRLDYSCSFVTADPPSRAARRGNALLSRRPVIADAVTLLHPFAMASTAGMIQLDIDGDPLNVYVTSLFRDDRQSAEDAAAIRAAQVQNLLRWIASTAGDAPSLVLGDMAASSGAPELQPLASRYRAARVDPAATTAGRDHVYVGAPLQTLTTARLPPAMPDASAGHGQITTIALPSVPERTATRH